MSLLRHLKLGGSTERSFLSDGQAVLRVRTSLERILTENILPFWYPGVVDTENGGYWLNHDLEGRWRGPAPKCIVTQARTVWFFSRLAASPYGNSDHLNAARHGYEFLRDRMWDKKFGGFYWEVDASGQNVTKSDKRLYGQAFCLYALAEYAFASNDPDGEASAKELFALMETRAHDKQHGGYREIFARDWTAVPARSVRDLNDSSCIKRMNTHIHLMEAIMAFLALTHEPRARERLIEIIFVNSNAVVRKNIGACTDRYLENWEPLREAEDSRVSYGHDVENLWLLIEACNMARLYGAPLHDLWRTVFNYALSYGFDHKHGGFYESGPFNKPADRREKIWWVQAEGLVAALYIYRLTDNQIYWDCFAQTLEWISNYQTDWKHGDWYETVDENGTASGSKAGPWKGPYHNGRAMLQCLDLLSPAAGSRRTH
jgi:cellobiose epimerase